uniref:Uncharacterized protein n=1 Tax=Candidatus Kentrum sp. SD TaxID=2126332 RepID=A0A450YP65_9GAMM|nr:MAG: hypothetical protein BECKSD772F_GA0070984_101622 [Candidatus Kentron sp. SD]VFK43334.1 MAG: hypothetical protein BECKSD772E_GA0070983_102424 [Candidatus Kentron sp. SD]
MFECISIAEARYIEGFRIFPRFNTGEAGEVDPQDLVHRYEVVSIAPPNPCISG